MTEDGLSKYEIEKIKKNKSIKFLGFVDQMETLLSKVDITLSLKTILVSSNSIFCSTNDNSSLAPSPVIKSLITSFTIGFSNRIEVLSVAVCEKLVKLIIIEIINGINFFIYFNF